jgi:hypothetical protein
MAATSTAAGQRGDRQTDTVLFIPSTVHGAVRVSGAARIDSVVTRPDGSGLGYVTTTLPAPAGSSEDAYGVAVGPASRALLAAVAQQAANPPQPISEPVARGAAESALTAETHSPNASIGSTAQLVGGLAGIVLGSTDPNGTGTP